jgi:hypothetical protein
MTATEMGSDMKTAVPPSFVEEQDDYLQKEAESMGANPDAGLSDEEKAEAVRFSQQ